MEGEQPTIAESEQVIPAIATEQDVETEDDTDKPIDLQQPEDGQAGDEEQVGDDDGLDELDFGFKKYRVPKELKAAVEDWRSATTKKEQDVAAKSKALESREAEITQRLDATEAELDARAELRGIDAQLAEYAKLTPQDWFAHQQNDPIAVQQAQLQLQLLKDRKAELEGTLSKATAERTEKAQQSLAKRIQETVEAAPKIIPGWKAETAEATIKELVEFAQSEGISDQVVRDLWSPQFLKILHRARIGTLAMQKQATAAPKPAPAVQPTLVPLEKVSGKSTPGASKSLRDIANAGDMEAYAKARQSGRVR